MTIQTIEVQKAYKGNDSPTTPYPVPFPYGSATDVRVGITDPKGYTWDLAFGVDYTVSAAGVTTVQAWSTGHTVTLYRVTPITQLTDYVENDAFPANTHEAALDKLTRICQELRDYHDRIPSLPPNGTIVGLTRDSFLYIDAAGQFTAMSAHDVVALLNAQKYDVHGTKVWWTEADRAHVVPDFIGQIGIQTDKHGTAELFRAKTINAGSWEQFTQSRGGSLFWSGDAERDVTVPDYYGQLGVDMGNAGLSTLYRAVGTTPGDWQRFELEGTLVRSVQINTSRVHAFHSRCRFALVRGCGAGASAGGTPTLTATGQCSAGQGGSGGDYAEWYCAVYAMTGAKQATVVVGAAATGKIGADGNDGGATTWQTEFGKITIGGGVKGAVGPIIGLNRYYERGQRSGRGSWSGGATNQGILIGIRGELGEGGRCYGLPSDGSYAAAVGGRGGGCPLGRSSRFNCMSPSGDQRADGLEPHSGQFGVGGSGGTAARGRNSSGNQAATRGGKSRPGIVLVYEYA